MRRIAIALILLSLAACGSGDETTTTDETATETPAPDPDGGSDRPDPGTPVDRTPVVVDPVDSLAARLNPEDEESRLEVADKLGEVGPRDRDRAVVVLEGMLDDESADVRMVAAQSIGKLGLPRLDALRSRYRVEEQEDVQRVLVESIFQLGGAGATQDLLTVANDVLLGENFRAFAIDALGRLNAKTARQILETCAEDISPVVRRAAVIALGKIASEASLSVLGERVGDNEPAVQIEAVRALRELKKRKCVRYLIAEIETQDARVLDEIVGALVEITGAKNGYDATKSIEENAGAVKAWLAWWKENESYY